MIKTEYLSNSELIHHWSDLNLKIRQIETGIIYDDAIDIIPCRYTYEETNEPIEKEEE